jgi:hypothetical protein
MSINIVQINNYDENVLELFLQQYANSVNLLGIASGANAQADELETALFEIRDLFWLDTATGVQLDTIGLIFVVDRNGKSDADYRNAIKEKITQKFSGEPESIIEILKTIYGATFVIYTPGWPTIPASYYIVTDGTITQEQLEMISPAGVQPFLGDFLVDALGNKIQDANGNNIIAGTTLP